MYKIETRGHCQEENIESRRRKNIRKKISESKDKEKAKIRRWQIRGAEGGSNNHKNLQTTTYLILQLFRVLAYLLLLLLLFILYFVVYFIFCC